MLLTGMYSSILPPAKTPKSFGPSFLSESMVKITFSITIPVIKKIMISRLISFIDIPDDKDFKNEVVYILYCFKLYSIMDPKYL